MSERIAHLAAAVFAAYARNSGNSPDDHFDRNAAEQWMTQALVECGVDDMIGALGTVTMLLQLGGMLPGTQQVVMLAVDTADAALARIAPNELHDRAAELRGRNGE